MTLTRGSFLLYSPTEETGASRSTSREAEGTGPLKPRQPALRSKVPIPADPRLASRRMSSDGRKEKD